MSRYISIQFEFFIKKFIWIINWAIQSKFFVPNIGGDKEGGGSQPAGGWGWPAEQVTIDSGALPWVCGAKPPFKYQMFVLNKFINSPFICN